MRLLPVVALWAPAICINLRKTEFDILISSRPSLILFTADGCKECDRAQKILDEVSPVLTKTAVASVNCNEESVVCDDAGVFTVPTLKFTSGNSDLVRYREALDASSIVKYVERQYGSAVTDLTNRNYIDFTTSARVVIVAFLGSLDNQEERKIFSDIAERWRAYYSFGFVNSFDEGSTKPSMAVFTEEEDKPIYYRQPFELNKIEAFLQVATAPQVREFDPVVYEQAIMDKKPLAQIFFNHHSTRAELVKSLIPLVKQFKDQMTFMTVYAPDYPKRCAQMHLSNDIKLGFAIADLQGRAYPMVTAFNYNRIAKHISAYLAGTLTATVKSEPVPHDPTTSQPFLTKLVGSTFDTFVYDKSRDILVEFHVPWCEYCTKLHVLMNALGSKYKNSGLSEHVALATIDVDKNDVPIDIDSYPSIRLYRADTNEIISFQGNFTQMLTEKQLDNFIFANGGHRVSIHKQDKGRYKDEL